MILDETGNIQNKKYTNIVKFSLKNLLLNTCISNTAVISVHEEMGW